MQNRSLRRALLSNITLSKSCEEPTEQLKGGVKNWQSRFLVKTSLSWNKVRTATGERSAIEQAGASTSDFFGTDYKPD